MQGDELAVVCSILSSTSGDNNGKSGPDSSLALWLAGFSPQSLERLRRINQSTTGPGHIIMALTYALSDSSIRAVNRLIIGLMLARHKAVRRGCARTEANIECKLQELHRAINEIVGPPPQGANDLACKTVKGRARAS